MNDIFYSVPEKIAFWISGYSSDYGNVNKFIKELEEDKRKFASLFKSGIRIDELSSRMIENSQRYKRMRVYWIETNEIPKNAFIFGEWKKGFKNNYRYGFYHINNDESIKYYWDCKNWCIMEIQEDYSEKYTVLDPQPIIKNTQYLGWTMNKWLED